MLWAPQSSVQLGWMDGSINQSNQHTSKPTNTLSNQQTKLYLYNVLLVFYGLDGLNIKLACDHVAL